MATNMTRQQVQQFFDDSVKVERRGRACVLVTIPCADGENGPSPDDLGGEVVARARSWGGLVSAFGRMQEQGAVVTTRDAYYFEQSEKRVQRYFCRLTNERRERFGTE